MNPILPRNHFIPDPEARVWKDGRLYIYGSRDVISSGTYCSESYQVFSTDNMVDWKDHGTSFDTTDIAFSSFPNLWAPDCVFKDGRYYLFFCLGGDGGREGVAVSDSPWGPFVDPVAVVGADTKGIDPAVLIDDDGEAYIYWGQISLQGAKLAGDMRSILPESYSGALLTESEHGFHEGACIRKVRNRYYLVYSDVSRGYATCLSYAVADAPLGPFEKKGVILDNAHCDSKSWNNHGSICEFQGQWYLFYHRSSMSERYNRRACVERITIAPDGSIPEVEMTTQGPGGPLPARLEMEAWRACLLYGSMKTAFEDNLEFLTGTLEGDFASFKYLDFDGESSFTATVRGQGEIFLYVDHPYGVPHAVIPVSNENCWSDVTTCFPTLSGVHSVHLSLSKPFADVLSFRFHT